jgi:hypothetical protein
MFLRYSMNKKVILMLICLNCASAQLLINEIMYNPSSEQGSDSYNEWIELFNPTNASVNVENWTLCDDGLLPGYVDHTSGEIRLNLTTVIRPGDYALITDGGTGTEVYENFDVNLNSTALHTNSSSICNGLGNDFGEIYLVDPEGILADFLNYSSSWGSDGDVKSLQRFNDWWNSSSIVNGTPGFENSISVTTTTTPSSTTTTSTTTTTTTSTTTTTTSTTTSTSATTTTTSNTITTTSTSATTTTTSNTITTTTTSTLPRDGDSHYPPQKTTGTTTTTKTTTTSMTTTTTTTTSTTILITASTTTTGTTTSTLPVRVQSQIPTGRAISAPNYYILGMIPAVIFLFFLSISIIYLAFKGTRGGGLRDL